MKATKNQRVIILIGLPGSGKSTWAHSFIQKNASYVRINRDDFRFMLKNLPILEPKGEELINKLQNNAILSALGMKYNVIVDNTNLKAKYINQICEMVQYRADVEFMYMDCSVDKCIERDKLRERKVGDTIIKRMSNDLKVLLDSFDFSQRPMKSRVEHSKELIKNKKYDKNLKDCVICDIDGTLALMGDRSPFDWNRVDRDFLNDVVKQHLIMAKAAGKEIIIVSGRDSVCKDLTEEWLKYNDIPYDKIFMRPKNDFRKDNIIKGEIYDEEIQGKYNVFVVYDDRNQVISMWRSLGLDVFQVAESPD